MSRLTKRITMLICCAALLGSQGYAMAQSKEYLVKAGFIYNFTKYISWPETIAATPLHICVLGKNDFGVAISIFDKASKPGAELKTVLFPTLNNSVAGCQILYISDSEALKLGTIIRHISQYPVLTVSSVDGFAKAGGIIEFTKIGGKIKIKINNQAAKQSGLNINAQLLEVAYEVLR